MRHKNYPKQLYKKNKKNKQTKLSKRNIKLKNISHENMKKRTDYFLIINIKYY